MSEVKSKRNKRIIYTILAVEIIIITLLTWKYGAQHLDSDDSAEMILAELLSREGVFLSKNWYYSTEIRVLNTQIITSLLFRLFSDWHVVRTLTTAAHLTILACSYLFLCRSVRLGDKLFYLAPLVLWPFSQVYCDIVLYGLYYIPHLVILLISLGLCLNPNPSRKRTRWFCLAVLALLAGLGGTRMLVICYIPLFVAAVVSSIRFFRGKDRSISACTIPAGIALAAAAIGYLLNITWLVKTYSFSSWDHLRFSIISFHDLVLLVETFFMVMGALGLSSPMAVFFTILVILMCGGLVFMLIRLLLGWWTLTQETRILLGTFIFIFFATIAGPVLTTMNLANRYLIFPCIGFVVILAAYVDRYSLDSNVAKILYAYTLGVFAIAGVIQIHSFVNTNKFERQDAAFQCILDSSLEFGFGDWNASESLTELSDGRIHVAMINNYSGPYVWYWLLEKDFQKYADGEPIFLILENDRLSYHGGVGHFWGEWDEADLDYLNAGTVIFRDENYTVWQYDSYEEFEAITGTTF